MRQIPSLPSGRKTETMGQRSLEVGASAFLKSEKNKKSGSSEHERKKLQIRSFSSLCSTTLETRFQTPQSLVRGISKGSIRCLLNINATFHSRLHNQVYHVGCPVLAVLFLPLLPWLSYPSSHVLTALS
jgi:hypothetical protein